VRSVTRLPVSVRFSLLLFVPLLVLMLLPVPCLGSECILLTSSRLTDPSSVEPDGLAGFCVWALGPLPAAAVIFALGLLGYRLTGGPYPQQVGRIVVWAMFSLAAYVVAWYGIILVTSIGASETPPMKFLGITALMALAVFVLGQPLVLRWLSLVDRYWKAHTRRDHCGRTAEVGEPGP
jgi:hypothetical protein